MPEVYIVESGCQSWIGHRCNFINSLNKAFVEQNIQCQSAINIVACEEILTECNALPIFSLKAWPAYSLDSISGELETMWAHGEVMSGELEGFLTGITENSVIYLPTATENELWAIYTWISSGNCKAPPTIVADIHILAFYETPSEKVTLRGRLLRFVLKKLIQLLPESKLIIRTYTKSMKEALDTILPCIVEEVAHPCFFSKPIETNPSKPLKIIAPGAPKGTKKPEVIVKIVENSIKYNWEFIIQNWPIKVDNAQYGIQVLRHDLSPEEYEIYISEADVMILPYDGEIYKYINSSCFEEAVSCGLIVLAAEGTWMAERIEAGDAIGWVVNTDDISQITTTLEYIDKNRERLKCEAKEKIIPWVVKKSIKKFTAAIFDYSLSISN